MASMFDAAKKVYEDLGVDVEAAFKRLDQIPVSLHCWQGDDVAGFENSDALDGGIAVTGNYPGRARNADELRADIEKVLSFLPGKKRLNLHAIYAETDGRPVKRNEIEPKHFARWVDWAKEHDLGLDFNPSYFSHPMMRDGLTLSSPDAGVRRFWVEHGIACRTIAESFGKKLRNTCITNFWVPDGFKDTPFDRLSPRERLADSLDKIFAVPCNPRYNRDAVESKLFGIGAESCTVGSHEFYMGYAVKNNIMCTLDMGHFHPTEETYDKISSMLLFTPEILLHVSRPVRWDSDHVVILNDSVQLLAQEIVWANALDKTNIGLDYFDASINRIGAYVIGSRATQKAFLQALLTPISKLRDYEANGKLFQRLAVLEEAKSMPWEAVYDYFCYINNVPVDEDYIAEVEKYEKEVTSKR